MVRVLREKPPGGMMVSVIGSRVELVICFRKHLDVLFNFKLIIYITAVTSFCLPPLFCPLLSPSKREGLFAW